MRAEGGGCDEMHPSRSQLMATPRGLQATQASSLGSCQASVIFSYPQFPHVLNEGHGFPGLPRTEVEGRLGKS